ncbi:ribosomal-processing cysteine protease Prp [Natranaerobius thermophilus]|uniref:Ribosomal processing cysteine protease Prp n=1 Tax=Natranaerobius thermophilus (strain ATCC BAA-1301 / DSM 18059 / JW/NM-WN-LF) TaxID=457570 RepID=B2A6B4_NATTJ|nr:ribosomal-processing cysteine protease Prp [Natranaerobius thermophilus]ACB84125.1 protein of unknown function DUF464 [Natranaerobius thermophilus JW/NM-WN-LF]
MIQVEVYRKKGKICGFKVEGHADYAREGEDIVCAAISALSLTGVFASEKLCNLSKQITQPEEGLLSLEMPTGLDEQQQQTYEIILETVIIGIYETAKNYPDYINIEDEGGEYSWN